MTNPGQSRVAPPRFASLGESHKVLSAALFFATFIAALVASSVSPKALATSSGPMGFETGPRGDLVVVPDLAQRVAKFRRVHMPFNSQGLNARERQMIDKLVDASGLLDCIYWRQSDPEGLKLYLSLARSASEPEKLLGRYLKINGSRFDLIDDEKPFAGTQTMPPGRGFFPEDMTRAKFDAYLVAHPGHKAALFGPQTIARWQGGTLESIPYHVAYREFLEPMAKDLREAA